MCEVRARRPAVGVAHGLVPQELDRVPIATDAFGDLITTVDRDAVRTDEMIRAHGQQVVDAGEQDHRVAILLAADREHVEEHRPHQVVDDEVERGDRDRHRVVCIRRCGRDVHLETRDGDATGGVEGVIGLDVAGRVWGVCRIAEVGAEPHADDAVRPVERKGGAELFDESACIGRSNRRRRACSIGGDARVSPHGEGRSGVGERSGRAVHVVEVGVHHRDDRSWGCGAQQGDRSGHFFHALTGVDGDDALGCVDERLVRQSIADDAPRLVADRMQSRWEHLHVRHRVAVHALTARVNDGEGVVLFEAPGASRSHFRSVGA